MMKSLTKGIFTISIDTEMAWGTFDHGGEKTYKKAYEAYRDIIDELLDLFHHFDVSATWAIVGHLFLDACRHQNGNIHPQIVRPNYNWYPHDWYSKDPGTNIHQDSFWYGRDLVLKIRSFVPKQEIASHSFGHIVFSDKGCSRAAAETDIAMCVDTAKNMGIDLKSFVFPRNAPGHLDILVKYGFSVYRTHPDMKNVTDVRPSLYKRGVGLLKDAIPLSPPVYVLPSPEMQGLRQIPASMHFRYALGLSRIVMPTMRYWKAKLGLKKAATEKKLFHLWFHPMNFYWHRKQLFKELKQILTCASEWRADNRLDVLPMEELI